ncbi:hypothetical protein TPHA_0J02600 [Tetrapisispora phaffii CBS 4417]|uniref:Decapping nuclease n=1 Tax=Tetrapisispora phaffii (strain ATCC 24235 / CBS 4417 / NBRC 1672 / NRRL Y-8282 / UCD 70-5) TaxID=1071381 RepID=G8BYY8_TETPH|nr:hypothetical protein TPHA_0J02600 [Tetrapisispora phaffii CBS 4417]CCE65080.1 hypothetical protein TPHA_0J02600 [Tetrapisispora phaffii CBS 4417]
MENANEGKNNTSLPEDNACILVEGLEKLSIDGTTNVSRKNKAKKGKDKKKSRGKYSDDIIARIPFKHFSYSNAHIGKSQPNIFQEAKGVALYYDKRITKITNNEAELINESNPPFLTKDISNLSEISLLDSKKFKLPYMGYNLYDEIEKFGPMDSTLLDSTVPCFEYLRTLKISEEDKLYNTPYTFMTPRHHLTELMMTVYESRESELTGKSWLFTRIKDDLIVISEDLAKENNPSPQNHKLQNSFSKKVINSGFTFEELVIENFQECHKPYFYISENRLTPKSTFIIRSEMDSYNNKTETFTELKCFNKLHLGVAQHRKKLLKTWFQTGLSPNCDIVIGIRDTSSGILEDLLWYSRENMYQKLQDPSLPKFKNSFDFKPHIGIQWLNHCIHAIESAFTKDTSDTASNPMTYKVIIDKHKSIIIKKLSIVPKNVEIPTDFL